jgi:23S rRNA (adenine1618-N6)-methyltransferase
VARGIPSFPKHWLPFPADFTFPSVHHVDELAQKLRSEMSSIPVRWEWKPSLSAGTGYAAENVWSRQARRKRQQQDQAAVETDEEVDIDTAALGIKVCLQLQQEPSQEGATANCTQVTVRWLKGLDSVLFESFCGMLKRKLEAR